MSAVSVFADDLVLADVIAVVLRRAGFSPADDAPVMVHARADRVDIVAADRDRVSLPSPVNEADLVQAVRQLTSTI